VLLGKASEVEKQVKHLKLPITVVPVSEYE
jgi:hypothetical protein